MLDDIISAAYMRFGNRPFISAHFYDVVRETGYVRTARACRDCRTRGEYHGYIVEDGKTAAGAKQFRLTPHGIARIEAVA
jgi:hypothetical protein